MPSINRQNEEKLQNVIGNVLDELNDYPGYDDDFKARVEMLEKLNKLKRKQPQQVSPDTIAIVGGNIITALIIIGFEQKHVITTKALNFFAKAR